MLVFKVSKDVHPLGVQMATCKPEQVDSAFKNFTLCVLIWINIQDICCNH